MQDIQQHVIMDIERQLDLLSYGHMTIAWILPPAFMLAGVYLVRQKKYSGIAVPLILSVLSSWGLRFLFRLYIELPVFLEKAKSEGDLHFDGVGGNVALLIFGWIEPLLFCASVALILKGITGFMKAGTEEKLPLAPSGPET